MSLFNELKRRNVFRVGIAYVVIAWLMAQVAELLLDTFESPDWILKSLLVLFLIGLPFALFFAWAFELTPDGIKKEKDVDRSTSITPQTGRKLDFTIIGILVVAVSFLLFDKMMLSKDRDAALVEATTQAVAGQDQTEPETVTEVEKSIAVLPFVNMSDDAANEYFSDGLSEELLNMLAKIPELRVAARTSSFSLKGKDLQIAEVGEILKVAHVLEGSVRKSGNQVRITTQLIKADDGYHMWSETYDRTLDNIFTIQDEIAREVVAQLKVTLLGEVLSVVETDPEAYALYLQARHLFLLQTIESTAQSIPLLKQALAIAPDYAAAWTQLGMVYASQAGLGILPFDEGFPLAQEMAEKALSVDPDNALAHALLGSVANAFEFDLVAATGHYQQALKLDPTNLYVINQSANIMASLNRLDEAITLGQYVLVRDPVNATALTALALNSYYAGLPDLALEYARRSVQLSPGGIQAFAIISLALLQKGQLEDALEATTKESFEGWGLISSAMIYYEMDRQADSDAVLAELIDKYEQVAAYNIAYVFAYRGEHDLAFEWLDKAVHYNDSGFVGIAAQSEFANIYDDPRWLPFLEGIGKSPAQLAAIEFNVQLPAEAGQ